MDVTAVIVTCDRAEELRRTLRSFRSIQTTLRWELLVVDNNSGDDTRQVVADHAPDYPVELRYLAVPEPGKYGALNQAILAARGHIIAATDDDASPEPDWLSQAAGALARLGCDYVGGPARPRWRGTPPSWLDARQPIVGKVLGLMDHGPREREFGRDGIAWPLGVNVAYRRDAFDRAGLFNPRLGRKAGTLLNQAQREWHLRARAAGLRGFYIPEMVVHHHVAVERLTRAYFRRWLYWHGISRALLHVEGGYDIEDPEHGERSDTAPPQLARVPRAMWRKAAYSLRSLAWRLLRGRTREAFDYELYLWFFAGVARQRWRDRRDAPRPAGLEPTVGSWVNRPPA